MAQSQRLCVESSQILFPELISINSNYHTFPRQSFWRSLFSWLFSWTSHFQGILSLVDFRLLSVFRENRQLRSENMLLRQRICNLQLTISKLKRLRNPNRCIDSAPDLRETDIRKARERDGIRDYASTSSSSDTNHFLVRDALNNNRRHGTRHRIMPYRNSTSAASVISNKSRATVKEKEDLSRLLWAIRPIDNR